MLGGKMNSSKRQSIRLPLRAITVALAVFLGLTTTAYISYNSGRTGNDVAAETTDSTTVLPSKTMPKSQPTRLVIPSINLDSSLITTGQQADGSIEMPVRYDVAAWYEKSPTPGEKGPSIIVGHVDNWKGIGVFFRLKLLKYGDTIQVSRADGTTAKFTVMDVKEFSKTDFPSQEVYGGLDYAGIRLITCGGYFDHKTGEYSDNIVVFGKLTD
jgi:LPXTG-site transpeptidase (sortase) family protein